MGVTAASSVGVVANAWLDDDVAPSDDEEVDDPDDDEDAEALDADRDDEFKGPDLGNFVAKLVSLLQCI